MPEAEIIHEGIKLAALGARQWDEPLIPADATVDLGGQVGSDDLRTDRARAGADKARRLAAQH